MWWRPASDDEAKGSDVLRYLESWFAEYVHTGLVFGVGTVLRDRLQPLVLEQWQQRAGLGRSPRTILDELRRIQSTDVVLPTHDGRDLRLRCVVRPDLAQARLLDRLGLVLPERLRIRPGVALAAEM